MSKVINICLIISLQVIARSQTVNYIGCGATYGTKIGTTCAIQFAAGQINQFDLYEVKINAHSPPVTTVGFGLSKVLLSYNFKHWKFDLVGFSTIGTTVTSTASTFTPTGGFLPTFTRGHFAISFGYIAQSGGAKGNLYGMPIGFIP